MEYDVNFMPAPDPPLLEGEIGDMNFDFDDFDETSEPLAKATADVDRKPVIDQGNQEAVKTQNLDKPNLETTQPEQFEQPVPDPQPFENTPTIKAPTRRPWHRAYHDTSNILESRLRNRDKPSESSSSTNKEPQGESGQEEHAMAAAISFHEGMEPQTIKEVYERPDRLQWEEAMKEEIEKLIRRSTWKIVPKPEGVNIVGSKWVFRLKKDVNGNVTSH